jgi:peptide-methionine (R)-S-oxide reductase
MEYQLNKTEAQWKKELGEEDTAFYEKKVRSVLIQEEPITYITNEEFLTVVVLAKDYLKATPKFDAHCGWPSFDDIYRSKVKNVLDKSHGMVLRNCLLQNCGSHLGHVFLWRPYSYWNKDTA